MRSWADERPVGAGRGHRKNPVDGIKVVVDPRVLSFVLGKGRTSRKEHFAKSLDGERGTKPDVSHVCMPISKPAESGEGL